jgi:hypothetical protein
MKYLMLLPLSSLLLISQTLVSQDGITVTKNGNVTSYTNDKDVVSYSSQRGDKQFIAKLDQSYHGLDNEEKLNRLLNEQNYIEVLNSLWTEPKGTKRLDWLEKKANEGHPILMLELGVEYYNQNPNLNTYIVKTMPWFMAGVRRTLIDAACTSDKSAEAAAELLLYSYQENIFEDLFKRHSQNEFESYLIQNKKTFQLSNIAVLKIVLAPLVDGRQVNQPSPAWVFAHGMNAFLNTQNTIPKDQWNAIRKKEAEEFLQQVAGLEKSLAD